MTLNLDVDRKEGVNVEFIMPVCFEGNSVDYEKLSVPFCENIQICGILHEKHFYMENFLYKSSV